MNRSSSFVRLLGAAFVLLLLAQNAVAKEGSAQYAPKVRKPPKVEIPIHAAVLEGDLTRVQQLLDNGWDVNAISPVREDTPLFAAIEKKHVDIANLLLDRGANVNFAAVGHSTPLHLAAMLGNPELIKRILELGGDPNKIDDRHHLPLTDAAQGGHLEAAKLLVVRKGLIDTPDTHDHAPLDYALELGKPDLAVALLNSGALLADTNLARGKVRIGIAAGKGWTEVVEIGLKQVESWSPEDRLSIAEAAYNDAFAKSHFALLERIAELVPNVASAKSATGYPRLIIAADLGMEDMVKLLIEQGADVNEYIRPSRWTALHGAAADRGTPNIVSLLLKHGANPNAADGFGRTPMHAAAINGRAQIALRLLQAGADPALADELGNTPLHYALEARSVATARVLIDHNAPQTTNLAGQTPYDLAVAAGLNDLAALLTAPAPTIVLPKGFDEVFELVAEDASSPEEAAALRTQWVSDTVKGMPLLQLATLAGSIPAVNKVLAADSAAVAQRDLYGHLALHYAAEGNGPQLTQILLDAGAAINDQTNVEKWTPLHFAAAAGKPMVVRFLLTEGANKNLRDSLGRTPAEVADLCHQTATAALMK